jgi:hypothetical protein
MYLTMFREPSQGGATLSKLFFGEAFICDILEDEVREIAGQPVSEWKIKGVTAIPAGVYEITLENSPRFGPSTLTVNDVPGYTGVRIHAGNKNEDTEGCLLPGTRNTSCTVVASRAALSYLRSLVVAVLNKGERVQIEIIPAAGVQA